MTGLAITLTFALSLSATVLDAVPLNYRVIFLPARETSPYPPEVEAEFHDVFCTGERDWRLAFRGTPGIGHSILDAYTTTQDSSLVEEGCKQICANEPCEHHFRNNDVMDNWQNIEKVAFVVYKGGQRVAHAVFDGTDTDNQNWLTDGRLLNSSWADLEAAAKNIFSIQGDDTHGRRFFLNHSYGGCANDYGWFVAVDRSRPPCFWEYNTGFPVFLYAKKGTYTNWHAGDVERADFFAIFVKYSTSAVIGG